MYKAVRAGDMPKTRSLQKLILKSQAARFLAIRQVTQLNAGKKTAGIDRKLALTFKERFELEEKLRLKANDWKHKGLREIPIPKKDGTKRILKVPTISDRAWQCLAKYALEPEPMKQHFMHEAMDLELADQHTMLRKSYSKILTPA